ncbi:MAG: hypothetical protein KatS3mg095_0211 [Candidatus Parcubacteria bacterium]|nr:MAG: hypothetical protein KatS3mg095_0211 [Candidatus Parcubacteria bacterium]
MRRQIILVLIFGLSLLLTEFVLGIGTGSGGYMPPRETQIFQPTPTSQPIQTSTVPRVKVICAKLKTLSERVKCRLSKTEEELSKEPFLPEECLTLAETKRSQCIKLYKAFNQCFQQESNLDSCALKVIGLKGSNSSEWVKECQGKKEIQKAQCKQNLRNKVLSYIKFYLYNLSYRLEEVKDKNNIDKIAEFITLIEKSKQDLNKANDKMVSTILDKIDKKWSEVVNTVNLPENFDKDSNIQQLKAMHDMSMSIIRNIR